MFDNGLLQVDQVLWVKRVGLVVRKGAIKFEIHRDDVDRQLWQLSGVTKNGRHGHPAHAVTGVDDDFQPANSA